MNRDLQAMMKKRRKQMGLEQEETKTSQQKPEVKTQKTLNPGFLEARKLMQAKLFKQNSPSEEPVQPKEVIKGNSESMKNAKALLQAKLNFGGNQKPSSNTGGLNLPPPPSMNIPGNLPPPPPLPPMNLLPPPPSLPNIANLPPPPSLPNMANLLPPPSLPNLPPPPPLPNVLPPSTKTSSNLPPPPPFFPPPSINIPPPPPNILPPPPSFNIPPQQPVKIPKTQSRVNEAQRSQFQTTSNRNSSKISEQQFRAFQNTVKKENSVDKKKSIFGNEPMIRSSNRPGSQTPPPQQIKTSHSKSPQIPQPIVLPPNQPNNQNPSSKPSNDPKISGNFLPPRQGETKDKKKIFGKQSSVSTQFFGKDVAGYLRRQFLKNNDILSYIDKKLPPPKVSQRPRFNFPSILQDKRGTKDQHFQPYQTLYIDTKTLNVSGPFLVNNLNSIRDHNDSRQVFFTKLKAYDIAKDPQKLHLRAIKELAQTVPSLQYLQPNFAKIYSCVRKCDGLIKQKVALKLFQQCQEIEDLRKDLLKLTEKYCKYPEDCKGQFEVIERIMNKVRDLEVQ